MRKYTHRSHITRVKSGELTVKPGKSDSLNQPLPAVPEGLAAIGKEMKWWTLGTISSIRFLGFRHCFGMEVRRARKSEELGLFQDFSA